jgi:hypothetical protein
MEKEKIKQSHAIKYMEKLQKRIQETSYLVNGLESDVENAEKYKLFSKDLIYDLENTLFSAREKLDQAEKLIDDIAENYFDKKDK